MSKQAVQSLEAPVFFRCSNFSEDEAMTKSNRFSPKVRERAVRMFQEYRGARTVP